jgi:hypothetical protein
MEHGLSVNMCQLQHINPSKKMSLGQQEKKEVELSNEFIVDDMLSQNIELFF